MEGFLRLDMSCCPCLDGKRDLFHQTIRKQQYQLPKLEETTAVSTYHNQYAGLLVNYGKNLLVSLVGWMYGSPGGTFSGLQICSFILLIYKFAVFILSWFANLQFSLFSGLQICSFHTFLICKFAVFTFFWFGNLQFSQFCGFANLQFYYIF